MQCLQPPDFGHTHTHHTTLNLLEGHKSQSETLHWLKLKKMLLLNH